MRKLRGSTYGGVHIENSQQDGNEQIFMRGMHGVFR
jgi:hypothetical protein